MSFVCPPPLRPGDRLRVVAPSSPFDPTLFWRGLGWLAERYRVEFDGPPFPRTRGFLAGDDALRAARLQAALDDPEARAIVTARGGYGATRIVSRLDWGALARHPKWLVGFSDITALHVEAQRAGVASMHAHNVCGLGVGDAVRRAEWLRSLEQPRERRALVGGVSFGQGEALGPLVGGNLSIVAAQALAGRFRVPEGAILLLEEIAEAPYRIDRMLTSLIDAGALTPAAGFALGVSTDCEGRPGGPSALEIYEERLTPLGRPIVAELPIGHGRHNAPVPLGVTARLEPGSRRLVLNAVA